MLYSPWRDEQVHLIQRNCEEFYQGNEEAIKAKFHRFNSIESLEDALRRAMEVEDIIEENIDEEAAVNEELRTLAFPEISSQINRRFATHLGVLRPFTWFATSFSSFGILQVDFLQIVVDRRTGYRDFLLGEFDSRETSRHPSGHQPSSSRGLC